MRKVIFTLALLSLSACAQLGQLKPTQEELAKLQREVDFNQGALEVMKQMCPILIDKLAKPAPTPVAK